MNREQINAFVIKETATVVEAMQKININAQAFYLLSNRIINRCSYRR